MSLHRFTNLIEIHRRDQPVDDFNVDSGESSIVAVVYADVAHMRDAERFYAGKLETVSAYRVTIRWPEFQIRTGDWIYWPYEMIRLDIESFKDPDGQQLLVELNCSCKESRIGGRTNR